MICVIYFVARLLWFRAHTYAFHGFIICDPKNHEIIDIPRYDYGQNLREYMQAAFAENSDIKMMWDKEPLDKQLRYDKQTGRRSRTIGKGHQLVTEATEYYVLDNLSVHLTDYFNYPGFKETNLHTFARNDIPDVL